MKAVLISIQPQWVEKIAARWKTLELRKSKPKLLLPFKCYIYQTRHKWVFKLLRTLRMGGLADNLETSFGKVVGEFVCDHILGNCQMANADFAEQQSCVRRDKIFDYSDGKQVFGWHISDLRIYEKPKPLSEFRQPCGNDLYCEECGMFSESRNHCGNSALQLKRPPQSWCYVEEVITNG